jgi:carbonic anhydrase
VIVGFLFFRGVSRSAKKRRSSEPHPNKEKTMSKILTEVLEANAKYSTNFGEKGKLAMPPARRFAILTCMDARLDPARFAGLAEGDAHVIRNAGGRASDDAIRSLVISYKLLGTHEFFVIHHTDCGMEFFTNDVIRDLLNSSLETAELTPKGFRDVGQGPGDRAGEYIEWLTIKNQRQSVLDDVARIRNHPLIPKSIPVHGYIYDVAHGNLNEVEGARAVGTSA